MQIDSVSKTNFGLKFDSYMQDKLDEAKKIKESRIEIDYYGLLNLKKWELAKKMLQSTLSDDYTLCLVPKDTKSYDLYLTSDKFNGYQDFLCKKINKREETGVLDTKQLDQLTERINTMKARNFKYCNPIIFLKDEMKSKQVK